MNTTTKYWMVAAALAAWLALAWLAGGWLNLQGTDLGVLRGALTLIGLAAAATAVWWFRGEDVHLTEEASAGSDEIDILLRRAQARLRGTQFGRAALADLPALLVLGEAGSAKTSVVLHGGLEPELLAGHTVQNDTPIPTRALNLWFAQPFVVAEAGSPLLHDPPRWARLVNKLLPGGNRLWREGAAPPRLALVCIDCEKVLTRGVVETLGASVEQLRARLREASHLWGINLPVYVLFTRVDRLQFFQDYAGALSDQEAAGAFGATLPISAYSAASYAEPETAAVASAFDNLYYALADCRVNLLAQKPDAAPVAPIYEFPREFKKLRSMLVPLLVDICRPGASRTTPFLRGFYFTGVRPIAVNVPRPALALEESFADAEGAPTSLSATRMMDIKKAVAVAREIAAADAVETRRVPQWVFINRLFKEVLFKDRTALATSSFTTRIDGRKKIALGLAGGALFLLILAFTVSSIGNQRLENQVLVAAQDVSAVQVAGRQLPSLDDLNKLETLRQSVETLEIDQRAGAPFDMRWGLYVGDALLADARSVYFRKFHEMLFQPAQAALLQTLSALPASPAANSRYDPAFEALKAYLLTTSDFARADREFLPSVLLRAWAGDRDIDSARLRLAGGQFSFYAGELKGGNPFSSDADTQAVGRARHYLAQFSGTQRTYRRMLAEAEKSNPPLDFNRKFPNAADVVTDQADVSGAFTKGGWTFMQSVWENPSSYLSGESWVLGQETRPPGSSAKRLDDLRRTYERDYIERWRSFLRGATVVHPVSLGSASQQLQKLAGDQSPLLALLCVAAQNTALGQADVAKAFQAVQAVTPRECQDQYVGATTSGYVKRLSDLQACVDRADNSPADQKDSAKSQCAGDVAQAEQAVKQIAASFEPDSGAQADQTVKDLLLAPINDAATLLRPGPVSAAPLCEQMSTLESLYPFNAQAPTEASLAEMAAAFAPAKGALSQFYASVLKNLLVKRGANYEANPASAQAVTPQFLKFFNRAMDVQRAFYPAGGGPPQFSYLLRPLAGENVSSLAMSVDGQPINFSGGAAQFVRLSWPGTVGEGVRLTVKIPGGAELGFPRYDGMWGVFHFFADGNVLQHNGHIYTLQWVLGGDRPVTAPNGKIVTVQFE